MSSLPDQEDLVWQKDQHPLTPEETILWLEGFRELMFEVWRENPDLRKTWEKLNNPHSQK